MTKFRCPGCGYTYDEDKGDDHEGYPPGFLFEDLPEDFVCPACAVRYKEDFVEEED
jgi:rubredoxin